MTAALVFADAWTGRWVESKHKSDYGKFVLTAGKFYGDAEKDKGESLGAGLCFESGRGVLFTAGTLTLHSYKQGRAFL